MTGEVWPAQHHELERICYLSQVTSRVLLQAVIEQYMRHTENRFYS